MGVRDSLIISSAVNPTTIVLTLRPTLPLPLAPLPPVPPLGVLGHVASGFPVVAGFTCRDVETPAQSF